MQELFELNVDNSKKGRMNKEERMIMMTILVVVSVICLEIFDSIGTSPVI